LTRTTAGRDAVDGNQLLAFTQRGRRRRGRGLALQPRPSGDRAPARQPAAGVR